MSKLKNAASSTNSESISAIMSTLARHTRKDDLWFIPIRQRVVDAFVDCTESVSVKKWNMLLSNVGKTVGEIDDVDGSGLSYQVRRSDRARVDEELTVSCVGYARGLSASVRNPTLGNKERPPVRLRLHNVLSGKCAWDNDGDIATYASEEALTLREILFPEMSNKSFRRSLYVADAEGSITFAVVGPGARVWTGLHLFGGGNLEIVKRHWQSRSSLSGRWQESDITLSAQPDELLVLQNNLVSLSLRERYRKADAAAVFLDRAGHRYDIEKFGRHAIVIQAALKFEESFFRGMTPKGTEHRRSLQSTLRTPSKTPIATEFVRYTGWRGEMHDAEPQARYTDFSSMLRWEVQGFLELVTG